MVMYVLAVVSCECIETPHIEHRLTGSAGPVIYKTDHSRFKISQTSITMNNLYSSVFPIEWKTKSSIYGGSFS